MRSSSAAAEALVGIEEKNGVGELWQRLLFPSIHSSPSYIQETILDLSCFFPKKHHAHTRFPHQCLSTSI
jgi:hypothetical protein